jgi:2-keto-4-pentenoate hydratase/2-oxohepta-3-ene-1,7-dioic acid hydratase in catechol pathway
MRIVVFGPEYRVGALTGEHIVDLNRAFARYASERGDKASAEQAEARVPSRLEAFISLGPAALEDAQRAIEHVAKEGADRGRGGEAVVHDAGSVKLHAPWPGRRIAMVGGNYADHLAGMNANLGKKGDVTTLEGARREAREGNQWGFWKVLAEVAGPGDEVPFPQRTKYLDYEGEVAIVLGKRGKDIPASRIEEYVWGVTLANDWSIRDGSGAPRPMSYNLNKNFDRSISIGPCIVVGEVDFRNVDAETRVNGELRQHFNSKDMIFSFGEILEFLSRDFSFVPGDVICGGTAAGTAADKSKRLPDGTRPLDLFLKKGDVVEVSSPQIGLIKNRLV